MILEVVERSRMRNSGEPGAFPQCDGLYALGPHQLIDRVQKRLPQFAVVIWSRHTRILANILTMSRSADKLSLRCLDGGGMQVIKERMCAEIEGEMAVFLIGMRINKPWKIHKWLPVAIAM